MKESFCCKCAFHDKNRNQYIQKHSVKLIVCLAEMIVLNSDYYFSLSANSLLIDNKLGFRYISF